MPAISDVLRSCPEGVSILGIIPLKALINDQYQRLEELTRDTEVPVYAWHGDISISKKLKALATPGSILLITPESLEALFVKRHAEIRKAFSSLRRIVVDELHAFIGTERGMQLQSLMHRVEDIAGKKIPRIGLSATLGDINLAADFLRYDKALPCDVITSKFGGRELRIQLRGYVEQNPKEDDPPPLTAWQAIGGHLYKTLRGSNNLAFANSRQDVEFLSDLLRRKSEDENVPNEFFPHHGNLSKEIREEAEDRLKKNRLPTSVVCTNTLELGIDIGSVTSIAQIGPPLSVAGLCQRIGRSGRNDGDPAILRNYIRETEWKPDLHLFHKLRIRTVQSVVMVQLLIEGWNEPPAPGRLHLSTFIQQLLSSIAQHGGITPAVAWKNLCSSGPFNQIGIDVFKHLLSVLGDKNVLCQAGDGTLLLGEYGERIVEHYSFYAAFSTPEELSIITKGKVLGTMTTAYPVIPGAFLIFAGKRWLIESYDDQRKQVFVARSYGGELPKFTSGSGALVHDYVRQRMKVFYEADADPVFLDHVAAGFIDEARKTYAENGLHENQLFQAGSGSVLVLWRGDRVCFTVMLALLKSGLQTEILGPVLTIHNASVQGILKAVEGMLQRGFPTALELVQATGGKAKEKYDYLLDEDLLNHTCSYGVLDTQGAQKALEKLVC